MQKRTNIKNAIYICRMEVKLAIEAELQKKIKKIVEGHDYYAIFKILKEKGDNTSREHIKNVIDKRYTTTPERITVITEYFEIKQTAITEQKKLAKQWDK